MSKIKKHKISSEAGRKHEKKKFSKEKLWTIILGGIMIFSVFGIMLGNDNTQEKKDYKQYKFDKVIIGNQYAWQTKIDDKTLTFDYHPSDVEAVNLTPELKQIFKNLKTGYVVFDPNMKHVDAFELARFNLGQRASEDYGIYLMNGITAANAAYTQPIVDCVNATAYSPVIKLVLANDTRASLDGNCVIIEANEYSINAIKDRLLYVVAGIIE